MFLLFKISGSIIELNDLKLLNHKSDFHILIQIKKYNQYQFLRQNLFTCRSVIVVNNDKWDFFEGDKKLKQL